MDNVLVPMSVIYRLAMINQCTKFRLGLYIIFTLFKDMKPKNLQIGRIEVARSLEVIGIVIVWKSAYEFIFTVCKYCTVWLILWSKIAVSLPCAYLSPRWSNSVSLVFTKIFGVIWVESNGYHATSVVWRSAILIEHRLGRTRVGASRKKTNVNRV